MFVVSDLRSQTNSFIDHNDRDWFSFDVFISEIVIEQSEDVVWSPDSLNSKINQHGNRTNVNWNANNNVMAD